MDEQNRSGITRTKKAGRSEEIDKLLVEGELVEDADGKQVRAYPRSSEIAKRLGVSPSWVSKYAKINRCFQRRSELRSLVDAKVLDGVARSQAKRIIFDSDRMLRICDRILEKFEQSVEVDGVGRVTAADINTLVRLRRFIEGDPDSRREVLNKTVTLETMQEAHRRMLQDVERMTPEECGMGSDTWSQAKKSSLAAPFDDASSGGEFDH